jgi:hypothetical protein
MDVASVKTHDKKSIYVKHERGYNLCMLTEEIYNPNFVARSLQIDSEEKGPPGRLENSYPCTLSHGQNLRRF